MQTQCTDEQLFFQEFGSKKVIVDQQAEISSSDGGLIFLREAENKLHIIKGMLEHFRDYRNKAYTIHSLHTLLCQRIFGIVQGYEDINDHDQWRNDPLLALACGLDPATQMGAGKSTLNRLEGKSLKGKILDRYHKFEWRPQGLREYLIKIALDTFSEPPKEIILDIDTTDFILNGNQEGKFFSGYYNEYCYQPLYIFAGELLICADLLTGAKDHESHTIDALKLVLKEIRNRWQRTRIIVRGDGGFCREPIMKLCEATPYCSYIFGLPKNSRLCKMIDDSLLRVEKKFELEKTSQREYSEFMYQTLNSWTKERRVIAKAEYIELGRNPRFIVTNLPPSRYSPQSLYEKVYCARGNMENKIKEQKLDLFADCSSTHYLITNQFRLWMSCFAYFFAMILRRGLHETKLAKSSSSTIRLRILKVSAMVLVSSRRIKVSLPKAYPWWDDWISLKKNLATA